MSFGNVFGLVNSVDGALSFAEAATDTSVFVDDVLHKVFADVCGALLIYYVGYVFVTEVSERGENGVGRSLP